jgi:hypothetical protein
MTLIEVATMIGNVLTQLDTTLQTPGLKDGDWQTLYALRKHLDDQQRELVGESLAEENPAYQSITAQLKSANTELATVLGDLTKVSKVIATVSQIASYADKILNMLPK